MGSRDRHTDGLHSEAQLTRAPHTHPFACTTTHDGRPLPTAHVGAHICHTLYSADLLLVLLPARSEALYREVKLASDAVLGLPSQVLAAPTAGIGRSATPRGRLQYVANLALKINAKMGGVNARLAGNPDQVIPVVGGRPFILFGVATALPVLRNGGQAREPCTAAVVASRDRSLGRYSARVLMQPASGDCSSAAGPVVGLRGAARELLVDFYRQNGGRKPEALLCYRATPPGGANPLPSDILTAEYDDLRG